MEHKADSAIPSRAETLKLLQLMGRYAPMLMLCGDDKGFGCRWTLHGMQVQPAIAGWLMEQGYLVDEGATEMGARRLVLSAAGIAFRDDGLRWWARLGPLGKLRVILFG
ncbi:MAG: hypothetical protein HZA62_15055 [Rhodocyclales bacterium]|nr:hypothetical protein [Rhodocyclales bacterium]